MKVRHLPAFMYSYIIHLSLRQQSGSNRTVGLQKVEWTIGEKGLRKRTSQYAILCRRILLTPSSAGESARKLLLSSSFTSTTEQSRLLSTFLSIPSAIMDSGDSTLPLISMSSSPDESPPPSCASSVFLTNLPLILTRLSARFFRQWYRIFFFHTRFLLFSRNLAMISTRSYNKWESIVSSMNVQCIYWIQIPFWCIYQSFRSCYTSMRTDQALMV